MEADAAESKKDFKHKISILEKYCFSIGRDPNTIQKSWAGSIIIAKTEEEVNKRLKKYVQIRSQGLTRAKEMGFTDYNLNPSLFGTPKQCIERIKDYIKVGVTHFMLNFPQEQLLEDLQFFAKEVISCF